MHRAPVSGLRTALFAFSKYSAFILCIVSMPLSNVSSCAPTFRSPSTLDAYVAPHNLELQGTIIEFLENTEFQRPRIQNQKQAANKVQAKSTVTKQDSPFQKWISPQKSTSLSTVEKKSEPEKLDVALRSRPENLGRQKAPEPEMIEPESEELPEQAIKAKRLPKAPKKAEEQLVKSLPKEIAPTEEKAVELTPLTRNQKNLRNKIRRVLSYYYNRPINSRDQSPWEVMHMVLAYEVHSKILQGGPGGDPITAVGWLCFNRDCKRRSLMYVNDEDKLRVRVGPALQGHKGQLLAMLAQAKVNREYPMLVDGKDFTVADLVRMEMETCYPRTELTFKLIGLMHYLDSETTWMNDQGMQWDIPRLIREEIRQPIRGAACGGTHRLSGLTLAYKTREKRGEPIDGDYLRAQRFVKRYQQYAYKLQNSDGSFSTEWFRGAGNEQSVERKLKTTGHTLEWLLYAASEKELKYWKTTKAVNCLANLLYNNRNKEWDNGIMGHALHSLLLYDKLVFQKYDPAESMPLAKRLDQPRKVERRR